MIDSGSDCLLDTGIAQPGCDPQNLFKDNPRTSTNAQSFLRRGGGKSIADYPAIVESYRRGYPRLAAFLNSANAFSSFRRFGVLRTRVLLQKQDELIELEEKLNALDSQETTPFHLCSRRSDSNAARQALINTIEEKLAEYGTKIPWERCLATIVTLSVRVDSVLDAYHRQNEKPRPKDQDIRSVVKWMEGNKPVAPAESTFLNDWDDLVATSYPEEFGMVEQFVTNCMDFRRLYCCTKVRPTTHTRSDKLQLVSSEQSSIYTDMPASPRRSTLASLVSLLLLIFFLL